MKKLNHQLCLLIGTLFLTVNALAAERSNLGKHTRQEDVQPVTCSSSNNNNQRTVSAEMTERPHGKKVIKIANHDLKQIRRLYKEYSLRASYSPLEEEKQSFALDSDFYELGNIGWYDVEGRPGWHLSNSFAPLWDYVLSRKSLSDKETAKLRTLWLALYAGMPGSYHGLFAQEVAQGFITLDGARRFLKYAAALNLPRDNATKLLPYSYALNYFDNCSKGAELSWKKVEWKADEKLTKVMYTRDHFIRDGNRNNWQVKEAMLPEDLQVLQNGFINCIRQQVWQGRPTASDTWGMKALGKLLKPYALDEERPRYMRIATNCEGINEAACKQIADLAIPLTQLPKEWVAAATHLSVDLCRDWLSMGPVRRMQLPRGRLVAGDGIYGVYDDEFAAAEESDEELLVSSVCTGRFRGGFIRLLNYEGAAYKFHAAEYYLQGIGEAQRWCKEKKDPALLCKDALLLYKIANELPEEIQHHIGEYLTKYPLLLIENQQAAQECLASSKAVSPWVSWKLLGREQMVPLITKEVDEGEEVLMITSDDEYEQ